MNFVYCIFLIASIFANSYHEKINNYSFYYFDSYDKEMIIENEGAYLIELKLLRSNNTFALLKYIKKKTKNAKIYFLIGADNLIKLHKWNNWQQISEFAKIIVFARDGYTLKALNSVASKKLKKKDWTYINSKKINISSSLIRKF